MQSNKDLKINSMIFVFHSYILLTITTPPTQINYEQLKGILN